MSNQRSASIRMALCTFVYLYNFTRYFTIRFIISSVNLTRFTVGSIETTLFMCTREQAEEYNEEVHNHFEGRIETVSEQGE